MKLLLARYVVPVISPPMERGGVLFDGARIIAVGPARELLRTVPGSTTVIDLDEAVLLPGFVNAHTHLELTCYGGQLNPAPLWTWFDGLLPLRRLDSAATAEEAGVRDGVRMSIESGVTVVGDISRTGRSADVLRTMPIRATSYVELISGASQPPSNGAELHTIVAELERACSTSRTTVGISPHAPYTVSPTDLLTAGRLAAARKRPYTMHLLETPEEAEWLSGAPGFLADFLADRGLANASYRPDDCAAWLKRLGTGDAPVLFGHVNYATPDVIEAIAETGASVVWCPRAHAYFGHRNHPWRALMARGVHVCVGTDSLASNESLSILDELRYVASRFEDAAASDLIAMGTVHGAAALGRGGASGELSPGAAPDFCILSTQAGNVADAVEGVVRSDTRVSQTWIAGECAYRAARL